MSRNIFISGTDHGLGAALARALAQGGAAVFAGVLSPGEAQIGQVERFASGGSIHRVRLDIGSDASVAQALVAIRQHCDSLDILINNGAILGDINHSALDQLDFDEMARVYNINSLGSLRLSQAALPLLLAGPQKLIVNISSEAASIAACWRDRWYAYAMSKAALNMQSALLHRLLKPLGGRVLVLHPGHVRTFMQGSEDLSATLSPEESAGLVLANIERSGQLSGDLPAFLGPHGESLPW